MASGKVIVPSKAITKKKEKANKKLTWTDQDTDVFAEVIYDPQYRGSDYTVGGLQYWNAIFKLSPDFHSAQHRDTRRETRKRFISRQIIRQNSSSDLYLDGLSV